MFCKRVNGKSQLKFKITLSILAIVFVAFLLVPETFAVEKTILKLNLKPSQKYNRVITMDENISQSMAGQQMDIAHTKKVRLEFEVKDVDAKGVASLKITYRTLQEKTLSTAGSMEYDTVIRYKSSPVLTSCTFSNNTAGRYGIKQRRNNGLAIKEKYVLESLQFLITGTNKKMANDNV